MKKFQSTLTKLGAVLLALPLLLPAVHSAYANSYSVPKLLITEVTPDSKIVGGGTGTPDAFEFVELYNTTSATINLKNDSILYETPTSYKWTITSDKYIAPKSTFVVWIKSDASATLADFNANYGTNLTASQVFEVSASGMANTAARTLSIAGADNVKISTSSYNPEDVSENIGIPYLYPTDGTNVMRKLTTDTSKASPGSVFAGQVPPATWEDVAPAAPTGLTAKSGSNQVTLSWNASTSSDLAFYRVYVDGVFDHTYRSETRSAVVTGLNPEENHTFEITAVDTSNNASAKTAITSAALSIPVTQASVVGTPAGSFPEYSTFFSKSTAGPIIPALAQDLTPQGMTYVASKNWFLVSHYREDGNSSMITAIDASTNKLVKSMTLYNADKTPSTGHVGGLAATATDVWVTVGSSMARIPLVDVINVANRDRLYIADKFPAVTKASFATAANNILWVGEFYEDPDYLTDTTHYKTTRTGTAHHAWMAGYKLDPNTGRLPTGKYTGGSTPVTPDYILSIADRVQGATVMTDGRFILSASYGRTNDSDLWVYENVLSQTPHYYSTVNGTSVPSYFLDHNSCTTALTAPPMAEGLTNKSGSLYVLFESAASSYTSNGKYPIDHVYKLDATGL
ncbi:lamin tail domain-containing protein [Tumebacillus permanentifrigoris]|uniref:Fibronectin type III domain protein n=1 Tax=Tumebacillus permanentifrigoris TaxID=378543 RepID=A0A316DAN7_9BACL|nr:lamin tail domain-containing protein [Tumebacillus permanentifrigoris]PWK14862.1 fibronectin type III domain protein [Tumebacillus permanentifrigoris]